MRSHFRWIWAATLLLGFGLPGVGEAQFVPEFEPQSARLKDIGQVLILQEVQLIGYGLVVGLEGVGDGRGDPFSAQSLANLMRNMGLEVDPQQIRAKNTASVMVTARLTPFTRMGARIDVTVSSVLKSDILIAKKPCG